MSEHVPGHGHITKLAVELGAAGLGLGAAGYLAYRKHHESQRRLQEVVEAPAYLRSLAVLDEPRVENTLTNGRYVLGGVAVRIFYASRDSTERILTKEDLHHQLDDSQDDRLYLYDYQLQNALGHLKQHQLIDRRPSKLSGRRQGYFALPALVWGMEHSEQAPPVLAEAERAFLGEQFELE